MSDIEAGFTNKASVVATQPKISLKSIWYEFLAMFLFVFVCCGSVTFSNPDNLSNISIALTFGLCITVLLFCTNVGQINSAVTVALMVSGDLNIVQGLCNIAAQIIGAIVGAFLIWAIMAGEYSSLGANEIPEKTSLISACLGEFMGTYFLCWVVFQTAVAEESVARGEPTLNACTAPIAIGLAVFLAHILLIDLTSCSINFPRSLGPAFVQFIEFFDFKKGSLYYSGQIIPGTSFWVYLTMPHLAGIVAGLHRRVKILVCPSPRILEFNGKLNSIESILAN